MSLQDSCMLVKLAIKQWDGFKKDNRVADDIDKRYHTSGGAGNYNKRLFDKSVLRPMQKTVGSLRTKHNELTMPWCYDGVSLLPNKLYFKYTEVVRNMQELFNQQIDNFIQQYPMYITEQATKLGDLFDPEEYPNIEAIQKKFSIKTSFFPVPDAQHFLLDIEQEEQDKIKASLEDQLKTTQIDAMQNLYDRIYVLLNRAHERLSDPQNIFRDTLINNLQEIVDVLPQMNVFGDEKLIKVQEKLQKDFLIADAQELRVDMPLRKQVADSAFDIMSILKP